MTIKFQPTAQIVALKITHQKEKLNETTGSNIFCSLKHFLATTSLLRLANIWIITVVSF